MKLRPTLTPKTIAPGVTAVRSVGKSIYSKRDGSYLEYDLNAEGNHSWNMAYTAIAKAVKLNLIADATEQGSRCVVRTMPTTVVSFDPSDNICRVGITSCGIAKKYEITLHLG
jgi:hypothetical protein